MCSAFKIAKMEQELNYISEKVEALDNKIAILHDNTDGGYGVGGRIGEQYRADLKRMNEEKQLLENIMNYITQHELS